MTGGKSPVGGTVDTVHHLLPKTGFCVKKQIRLGDLASMFVEWGANVLSPDWNSSSPEMHRDTGQTA